MKKILSLLFALLSVFSFAQTTVRMSATATGTDTYSTTFNPTVSVFNQNTLYVIPFTNANSSGTVTIDPDAGGAGVAIDINGSDGNDLDVGAIVAGGTYYFKFNGTNLRMLGAWEQGTGGGHSVEEEGTPLTARSKLNFVGAGVTATDDSGDDASVITIPNANIYSSTSLTDGSAITITGALHTLTTDEATITFTLSQLEAFQSTTVIVNTATTTWTFPANTLCRVNGVASGDNTATLVGNSGDIWEMVIKKDGTNYKVSIANWEQ
jgi:hypothetical protein